MNKSSKIRCLPLYLHDFTQVPLDDVVMFDCNNQLISKSMLVSDDQCVCACVRQRVR